MEARSLPSYNDLGHMRLNQVVYPHHSGHDSGHHSSGMNLTSATYHLGKLIHSESKCPHL